MSESLDRRNWVMSNPIAAAAYVEQLLLVTEYAVHKPTCHVYAAGAESNLEWFFIRGKFCDCGLDRLLQGLEKR